MNQKAFAPILAVLAVAVLASTTFLISRFQNQTLPEVTQIPPNALFEASISATPTSSPSAAPTVTPISSPSATPSATATPTPTKKPEPVVTNNTPPGSGFSIQNVSVEGQTFKVAIIAANLNTTKVIIDTASDSDCSKDCPVLSLGDYVARNGAWAGINGSYFCPADYATCADKKNSFDTLVMNKSKYYFNSSNNVYSTVPAAIFSPGGARFVSQSLEWGRDTGVDGVIANYPQLLAGGNISYSENPAEPKFGARGARNFVGGKGSTVYIGTIFNATMGESAQVLKSMGMNDALNLDEGGSTALWYGGKYLVGPGRNIPNAVLFVKR